MKRLMMILAALLVVAPVMAGEKELQEFKENAIASIENFYDVPSKYVGFEMTCYPSKSFDEEGPRAGLFSVDFSSSGPKNVPINVEILKELKDKNGFCVIGPIDTELRKQQEISRVEAIIDILRHMEESKKQQDKLQGETHTDLK